MLLFFLLFRGNHLETAANALDAKTYPKSLRMIKTDASHNANTTAKLNQTELVNMERDVAPR